MSVNVKNTSDNCNKALYYSKSRTVDITKQSVEIDPVEHIRRDPWYKDVNIRTFYKSIYPKVRTLGDILHQGFNETNDGPCIGRLPFPLTTPTAEIEWISYSAIIEQSRSIGTYLWSLIQLTPMVSKVVTISANCLEYTCVEHACYMYGFIVVGLHSSSDLPTVMNVLARSQAQVLVVDNLKRILPARDEIWKLTDLKNILTMDDEEDIDNRVESISSILKKMKTMIRSPPKIDPDSTAMFLLTSGTTGEPKMAMVTHENILAMLKGEADRRRREHISIEPEDRHLSFLPMTHCFERTTLLSFFLKGAQIVYCPSIDKLFDYMAIVKPTRICMVPRILNNLYGTVTATLAGTNSSCRFSRISIQEARDSKEKPTSITTDLTNHLSILHRVKQLFGGEVKSMLIGSAPIAPEVLEFFRLALDVPVVEGYAQTESSAAGAWTYVADVSSTGTIGVPMPTVEIKLIDVVGTPYNVEHQQGEICMRGPTVFKGYYREEAKTRETIDSNGWLHTGDVGEWTSSGSLRIIDRCKNIFKLDNGKYVTPEPLERIYLRSSWVNQIFVDGNSTESTVVAVVVPDEHYVRKHFFPTTESVMTPSLVSFCRNLQLKQYIHDDLIRLAKQHKLHHCEIVSNIHLHPEPFTQANGLVTSTMKLRRAVARQYFHESINQLYLTMNNVNAKQKELSKL